MKIQLKKLLNNHEAYLIVLLCSVLYNTLYFHPFGITRNYFFYLALVWGIYFMIEGFLTKKIQIQQSQTKLLLAFSCIMVISTLLNISYFKLDNAITILLTVEYFFSVYLYPKQEKRKINIEMIIIIFLVVCSTISLGTMILGINKVVNYTTIGYSDRLWGIFNNPNTLGTASVIGIFLCAYEAQKRDQFQWFYMLGIIMELLTLAFSKSRNNILFFVLIIFLYFVVKKVELSHKQKVIVLGGIGLGVVLVTILLLNNIALYDKVNAISNYRIGIWKDSILMVSQKPLLGYGVGSIREQFCSLLGSNHIMCLDYLDSTHNFIFDLIYSTGAAGAVIFMNFLGHCFINLKLNTISILKALILFLVCCSLLDYSFIYSNTLLAFSFWYYLDLVSRKEFDL